MPIRTQAGRPISISTPLGPDALLLTAVEGHEEVSGLFSFRLELLADRHQPVPFEDVLGKQATVTIEAPPGGTRYIDGIVCRLSQGRRDATFTHLEAVLVPRLWLLTRKVRSRIFQRRTVPEILDAVLAGVPHRLEVAGAYEPRDYCAQYRESDFAFVSRLMEEEGIRYYFVHSDGAHEMVVTDAPVQHPAVPGPEDVAYDEVVGRGQQDEMRVYSFSKSQEVRSSLTTLRDHCFELPGQSLEAQQATVASVKVGEVEHALKVVEGEELELYDFPGGYAQRFDGVASGGAPRPAELGKVFRDGLRTVRIRMEQEEAEALEVRGESTCRHFVAGHQFNLRRHFDGNGPYVLTRVEHAARLGADYASGAEEGYTYENRFTAMPAGLPCRPPRRTPRPVVAGTQTATVVTPPGEELWCDRYGRVKVQFHWDREGTRDLDSSCWVRVAQTWAGRGWGAVFWPRAGNEVIVAFEEGDPDQPVIVGSVYNAENMPPFDLPLHKDLAGFKSASLRGYANQHFNGLVFIDALGDEHVAIHSQRTMTFDSELDKSFHSGRNRHEAVSGFCTETIGSLPGGGGGGGPDLRTLGGPPSGGGSGGGLDDKQKFGYTFKGNREWHPIGFVQPSGEIGLKSSAVFGESVSVLCGLSRSATMGQSTSMTIDPTALAHLCGWKVPEPVQALSGASYGGSTALTLGSKVALSFGKSFTFSVADDEKKLSLKDNRAALILAVILAAATFIYFVAYGLLAWDIVRTVLTILYDLTVTAILRALVIVAAAKDKLFDEWSRALDLFFKPFENGMRVWTADFWKELAEGWGMGGATVVAANLLTIGAAAAGAITTAAAEIDYASQP